MVINRDGAMMETSRRSFLTTLALLPLAAGVRKAWTGEVGTAFVTCGRDDAGHAVFGLDLQGNILWRLALPGRGHGFGVSPDGRTAVVSARRPGHWALRFDPRDGSAASLWQSDDLAFCGHGVFLGPDRLAFTAVDADGHGAIVLHDATSGERQDAWPTEGADPHELLLVDGALIVANGGDAADPSALLRMDAEDGTILARAEAAPELHRLSLRHLAPLPDGGVAVVAQDRSLPDPAVPLLAFWRGGDLEFQDLGPVQLDLRGYCGSVAANGQSLCITSPQGGTALTLPARKALTVTDVCGVAPMAEGFLLTGGKGDLILPDSAARRHDVAWDNHVRVLDPT
jgi:hypothetical protein